MADAIPSTFLKEASTLKAGEDPFKYDVFRKAVSDVAERTKQVSAPDIQPYITGARRTGYFPSGSLQEMQLRAAAESYRTQTGQKRAEAEKAGQALTMMGDITEASMRRLGQLQTEAVAKREKSAEAWGAAAEKAKEYVQSAQIRTRQALDRLDTINTEISEGRDFAKAHAMNAAVQATIGSMNEMEQQTIQRYGIDSKEYEQFQAKKVQSLGAAQSQIETNYRQLDEQQSLAYMNASNELQWKEDMYVSFQEQQHVETLRYLAQASDAYDMQMSQFNLAIEQIRTAGMENMANWLVQTPVFSMDVQPFVTLIAEIGQAERARQKVPTTRNIYITSGKQAVKEPVSYSYPTTFRPSEFEISGQPKRFIG